MGEEDKLAEEVINLFQNTSPNFERKNIFAYMASVFYYKQRYHLINILKLDGNYDSQLICRCMIEGSAILSYVKDNLEFANEWYEKITIENYRIMQGKSDRCTIDPKQKERIKQEVAERHYLLKQKQLTDIKQTGREPSYDDFKNNKIPMSELVKELSEKSPHWNDAYIIYDNLSKWQHWNIAGISQFIDITDGILSIRENYDYDMDTTIKLYSIFCLIETSVIYNDALNLGNDKQLGNLISDITKLFINTHTKDE